MKPISKIINAIGSSFDKKRFSRQVENFTAWKDAGYEGTIVGATGYGKSMVGMLAVRHMFKQFLTQDVLIVVPSNFLLEQWKKHLKKHELENVRVMTIQALIRTTEKATLLVLDEIHRYKAEEFGKVYDRVSYQYVLGLTATLDTSDPKYDIIKWKSPVVDTVTVEECHENGWISDYIVMVMALKLQMKEQQKYDEYHRKFVRFFGQFGHDFNMMKRALNPKYRKGIARKLRWTEDRVAIAASNGFRFMGKRREVVEEASNKVAMADKILSHFTDRKIVTFSKKTYTANQLSQSEGRAAYHSKLPTLIIDKKTGKQVGEKLETEGRAMYIVNGLPVSAKKLDLKKYERISAKRQLDQIIKDFEQGKYYALNTAQAIDEGADIEMIDFLLTISGDSSYRRATQRRGRGTRKYGDKVTIDLHLYLEDTPDEKWLNSRLDGVGNIQMVHSISEIEDALTQKFVT